MGEDREKKTGSGMNKLDAYALSLIRGCLDLGAKLKTISHQREFLYLEVLNKG